MAMQVLWTNGPSTAEQVREKLHKTHPMKDATVRTILRRLEAKGYATHREVGRTYLYSGVEQPESLAVRALRQVIDRFWGGSAHALVVGMVEQDVIEPAELKRLSERLEREKGE
jgi:BlaI family penicillinase repressor